MTDSLAESLSTIGLVAGFPLLLLCFMLSLEKLESWGLGDGAPGRQKAPADKVEAALDMVERLAAAPAPPEPDGGGSGRAVAAQRSTGWADRGHD